jgi:hypothetical protein
MEGYLFIAHMGNEKYTAFIENVKGRRHVWDQGIDGWIILKRSTILYSEVDEDDDDDDDDNNNNNNEIFEVFTAIKIQIEVFWVVTPCSVVVVSQPRRPALQ